ncbi:DUF1499 domain-containing protein [Ghiorsea bivora]|uniref:DUF1499 domain-containing protein n=1 Tax=Ghiorsea bivora TaxID=1485545 RepID=UPI00056F11BC|nr:DUF1499 domain-containing protein [Ghiorsea bivora]
MKTALFSLGALALLGLIIYIAMAVMSQKTPDTLGLQNGKLAPCPDSPNCVCSESHTQNDAEHYIQAIHGDKDTWDKLKEVIMAQGGTIESDDGVYMHASFRSAIFQYVDDVELRLDETNNTIHIRSASRMGRKDFGVNRNRVEAIKKAL